MTSEPLFFTTHDSDIGTLLLIASNKGLRYLRLVETVAQGRETARAYAPAALEMNGFFASSCGEIDNYLEAGKPLKLPYELVGGTPLQRAVWLELSRLRYCETISYTALAEKVGFPRAVRAIASACGANPLPLVIPCHRVISKDGSLGGFSLGGLEVKERLLSLEAKLRFAAA
ncbi:MAG: methylated-DNA--[protein]-cysteine S-methyltransferase [Rickettsiales bacterium]